MQQKLHRTPQETQACSTNRTGDSILFRLEGTVSKVRINHGHFLDSQKNNETGNSTENLGWVIKLKGKQSTTNAEALEKIFIDPALRESIDQIVHAGLSNGAPLELGNDAIKQLLQTHLDERMIGDCQAKFVLKRPGVIPNTLVVVGETVVLLGNSVSQSDNTNPLVGNKPSRKYTDFPFETSAFIEQISRNL